MFSSRCREPLSWLSWPPVCLVCLGCPGHRQMSRGSWEKFCLLAAAAALPRVAGADLTFTEHNIKLPISWSPDLLISPLHNTTSSLRLSVIKASSSLARGVSPIITLCSHYLWPEALSILEMRWAVITLMSQSHSLLSPHSLVTQTPKKAENVTLFSSHSL